MIEALLRLTALMRNLSISADGQICCGSLAWASAESFSADISNACGSEFSATGQHSSLSLSVFLLFLPHQQESDLKLLCASVQQVKDLCFGFTFLFWSAALYFLLTQEIAGHRDKFFLMVMGHAKKHFKSGFYLKLVADQLFRKQNLLLAVLRRAVWRAECKTNLSL